MGAKIFALAVWKSWEFLGRGSNKSQVSGGNDQTLSCVLATTNFVLAYMNITDSWHYTDVLMACTTWHVQRVLGFLTCTASTGMVQPTFIRVVVKVIPFIAIYTYVGCTLMLQTPLLTTITVMLLVSAAYASWTGFTLFPYIIVYYLLQEVWNDVQCICEMMYNVSVKWCTMYLWNDVQCIC